MYKLTYAQSRKGMDVALTRKDGAVKRIRRECLHPAVEHYRHKRGPCLPHLAAVFFTVHLNHTPHMWSPG